jgi:predicted transcriptional regulator
LFRHPEGATAETIASGLDRHRSTVSTYLNMLVTLGFAEKFRDGHEIYYKAIIKSEKEENIR